MEKTFCSPLLIAGLAIATLLSCSTPPTESSREEAQGRAQAYVDTLTVRGGCFREDMRPSRPEKRWLWGEAFFPELHYASHWAGPDTALCEMDAVSLENGHLLLQTLPELGGAALKLRDKRTGLDVFRSDTSLRLHYTFWLDKAAHAFGPITEHGFNSLNRWEPQLEGNSTGAGVTYRHTDRASGMELELEYFLPHGEYRMRMRGRLHNSGEKTQKGMLWLLQVADQSEHSRLFFPTDRVVGHTSLDLDSPLREVHKVFDYLTPLALGEVDGQDWRDVRHFPFNKAVYAREKGRTWAALHDPRRRVGFAKMLDPRAKGLKYFRGPDYGELFSGSTQSLEHYDVLHPGETHELEEWILPTTGLSWVTHVWPEAVLGLYADSAKDSLYLEYMPATGSGRAGIEVSVGKQHDQRVTAAWNPGQVVRLAFAHPGEAASDAAVEITLLPKGKAPLRWATRLDSLATLSPETLTPLSLDSALALQQGAGAFPLDQDFGPPAKRVEAGYKWKFETLWEPDHRANGKSGTESLYVSGKDISHKLWRTSEVTAAAQSGDRLFMLAPGKLMVATDTVSGKPGGLDFFYNTLFSISVDTSRYGSRTLKPREIELADAEWVGDMLLVDGKLYLAAGKSIRVLDTAGALIDSLALPSWPAGLAMLDSHRLAVVLPFEDALLIMDFQTRTHTTVDLGELGLRSPWALAASPSGLAVSSGVERAMWLLTGDLEALNTTSKDGSRQPLRAKRFPLPDRPAWRNQVRGVTALAWHPGKQRFLYGDPDAMSVNLLDPMTGSTEPFLAQGLEDGASGMPMGLSVGEDGRVLVVQQVGRAERAYSQIKSFTAEGRFAGGLGEAYRGDEAPEQCRFLQPWGEHGYLAVIFATHTLARLDSSGRLAKGTSGYGWGPGLLVYPPGVNANQATGMVAAESHGIFVADLAKHAVLHYDTSLVYRNELVPPGDSLTFTPTTLALHPAGRLCVVDGFRNALACWGKVEAEAEAEADGSWRFEGWPSEQLPVAAQRIYPYGKGFLVVDILANKMSAVVPGRAPSAPRALPESFVASALHAAAPDGGLYIRDLHNRDFLHVTAEGEPVLLERDRLPGGMKAFIRLADKPSWKKDHHPEGAAYLWRRSMDVSLYLDEELRPLVPMDSSLHWGNFRGYTVMGDTMLTGVQGFEGVWKIHLPSGKGTWLPLDLGGAWVERLRVKGGGIVGAVTQKPWQLFEFDLSGRVHRHIAALPAEEMWSFGYDSQGRLVLPQGRDGTVLVLDDSGATVLEHRPQPEPWMFEDAQLDGNGNLFGLFWRPGAVLRVDSSGRQSPIFSGKVEGRDRELQNCPWLALLKDGKILVAEGKTGVLHLLGPDGSHLSSWDGEGKRRNWGMNLWDGQRVGPDAVTFLGRGGVHRITVLPADEPGRSPAR